MSANKLLSKDSLAEMSNSKLFNIVSPIVGTYAFKSNWPCADKDETKTSFA